MFGCTIEKIEREIMIDYTTAGFFGTFLLVALYFSGKKSLTEGYRQGVEDALTSVEEALNHDKETIDGLYEKMAQNHGIRITITEE